MSGAQETRHASLHIPVMLDEVSAALRPEAGKMLIDATFGNGGYSMHFLNKADCRVAALDRDPDAIARGQAIVYMRGHFQQSGRWLPVQTLSRWMALFLI